MRDPHLVNIIPADTLVPNNTLSISSGDGLVPSDNKPLPEPMLTQIFRHIASLGHDGPK